ncbi:MAG: glutaminyl-peptide cyclotransferase [Acidobacteria bacterium]|nr:glutaminyl-peptide cyclotransferase [Acidobacteriota bacterium]
MRHARLGLLISLLSSIGPGSRPGSGQTARAHVPEYTFEVVRQFPHDSSAFTQGLAYSGGYFYEGTGLEGRSSLRQVRPETGEVLKRVDLPPEYFGEGIAALGDEIVQLTWQSQTGFRYRLRDFKLLRKFSYPGEGWGLTTDGRDFFMSDGTAEIRVLGSDSFREKRRIRVHEGASEVSELNELEFVEGEIYANVWHTDRIARISPETGKVLGWINLAGLISPVYRLEPEAVLNGIAYDPRGKRLFVTGKLWPAIFEIRVVRKRR